MPVSVSAFAAVFVLAAVYSLPIGPVQIEVWREALADRRGRAGLIAAGAAFGDAVWALAADWSFFTRALSRPLRGTAFLAAAALTGFLGFRALRPARTVRLRFAGRHWAFFQGAACVLLNPAGLVAWTIGLGLLNRMGLAVPSGMPFPAVFFATVMLGAIIYPLFVIVVLAGRIRIRLQPDRMERVSRGLAYLLFGLGAMFLIQAGRSFF